MSDPITTSPQAQDAAARLGRDTLAAEERRQTSAALVAYLEAQDGRQVLQGLLARVASLLDRVSARLDVSDPVVARAAELLHREVTGLEREAAEDVGRARDGSRILILATSRPALILYGILATAISGWLGIQTGSTPPTTPGAASAAEGAP
jgi:hypothetical protein